MMRRCKLSPATIIACIALFVALGGTAVAASQYLITRTNQIKPSVLRQIRGEAVASAAKAGRGAKAVVVRVRSEHPVEVTTPESEVADPLSGASWTQGAEELNEFVAGQVTITVPSAATCVREPTGALVEVDVFVDGHEIGSGFAAGETTTTYIEWDVPSSIAPFKTHEWLPEPGKATTHTVSARASYRCSHPEEAPKASVTVDSVSFDVIGAR